MYVSIMIAIFVVRGHYALLTCMHTLYFLTVQKLYYAFVKQYYAVHLQNNVFLSVFTTVCFFILIVRNVTVFTITEIVYQVHVLVNMSVSSIVVWASYSPIHGGLLDSRQTLESS